MGEFKSLLRKISDDYHGPRSLPLVGKFGEVSYAPPEGDTKPGTEEHSHLGILDFRVTSGVRRSLDRCRIAHFVEAVDITEGGEQHRPECHHRQSADSTEHDRTGEAQQGGRDARLERT